MKHFVARGRGPRRGRGGGFPGIFHKSGDGDGDEVGGAGEKNTGDGVPVSPDLLIFRPKSLQLGLSAYYEIIKLLGFTCSLCAIQYS